MGGEGSGGSTVSAPSPPPPWPGSGSSSATSTSSGAGGSISGGDPGSTTATSTSSTGASTGGSSGIDTSILCAGLQTAAGPTPTKGGPCTSTDPALCYKTCGPEASGFKSETCVAGIYAEQSGCYFPPDLDYSCYRIPAVLDPSCPATLQASTPCTVAPCTVCDVSGEYLDTTGAIQVGYCVCAGNAGITKWSCAHATAWPCPANKGC